MSQSVLVTGGAGYIGSHACKALARAGYQPVVFDNLSRGHREAVRWGPLIEGDLADQNRLVMALEKHQVAAVMHFAAYAYVGESMADPAMYYRNNLGGSLSLIEAMRETGVDKIVFSSTCATYGIPAGGPLRESVVGSVGSVVALALVTLRRLWFPNLFGGSGGKKEPGIEPFRHPLGFDFLLVEAEQIMLG